LLREIRGLGYPGSMNLLVRYINQGRLDSDHPHLSPCPDPADQARPSHRRPGRDPRPHRGRLPRDDRPDRPDRSFAQMLAPARENEAALRRWITTVREPDLPCLHSFTRGLDLDVQAVTAALTLPFHNGRTEGVNTKTKMIKRQMYGRTGFALLRHRILLG
jgi:hypothetical protein